MPALEDDHPDHCATAIFTREALKMHDARRAVPRMELFYLVHTDNWPSEDEPTSIALRPPRGFDPDGQQWRTLPLTSDEVELKGRVLNDYASQQMVIGRFMKAFARPNELFLEGRPAVAPECWCDEKHVATELPPERYRRHLKRRR
jgi:LmbE family N-acetylglucosaminyl deacetylase